ncbi:MAG TPA: hypothetical protein VNQ80_02210 [Parapedobacter sp.]|uniref:glycosyltransferase family 1 protein n=1 Tax=Parapedobacter sp. TaxID=1958893 RepID=UPI002B7473C4|nr:glycosyltransferase family 1 protein [Parapedobacter sp.]HWK56121.1 hypothetical protein [Parapedobacter sp.]
MNQSIPTVVILGAVRYAKDFHSTSLNTAIYLSQRTHVLYIENPFTVKDQLRFSVKKAPSNQKGRKSICGVDQCISSDLEIITPPVVLSTHFLPEGWLYRRLQDINEWRLVSFIRLQLRRRGITEFVFINSFNFHYPGVGRKLKPLSNIYQCVDPLVMDFDSKHGVVSEKILLNECDAVFCTSSALFEEKRAVNANTHFIPNAADAAHFRKATETETPIHECLQHIDRPIVGYIGTVERRLDYVFLKELFASNLDKRFVFVGPVSPEFVPDWFYTQPNVELISSKKYVELPSIIKGFDACLIPFKVDSVSRTIFPLKLFEFLGSGKPVLATNFNPDLKAYTGSAVDYCGTVGEMNLALDRALNNPTAGLATRLEIANQNTWEQRIEQIIHLISKSFREK